jgi:hypothetical protein
MSHVSSQAAVTIPFNSMDSSQGSGGDSEEDHPDETALSSESDEEDDILDCDEMDDDESGGSHATRHHSFGDMATAIHVVQVLDDSGGARSSPTTVALDHSAQQYAGVPPLRPTSPRSSDPQRAAYHFSSSSASSGLNWPCAFGPGLHHVGVAEAIEAS